MIREALDRAKTTSTLGIRQISSATARAQTVATQPRCLANSLHKETRALATQRFEACAGRQGVKQLAVATLPRAPAAGCSVFSLAPAERCSWSKLSRRSVCRVKVSGRRARSCSASKAGERPTAATTLSGRSALVEAKAAAIPTLGVGGAQSFALGQSRALALPDRLAVGSFTERRRRAGDLLEVGDRGWQQAVVRSAALEVQGGSDGSVIGAIVQGAASAISSQALGPQRRPRLQRFCRGRASPYKEKLCKENGRNRFVARPFDVIKDFC